VTIDRSARNRDTVAIDQSMQRVLSTRAQHRAPPRRGATRASRRSDLGGTLLGLFVGLALGLGLAAGVAYYLLKSGNPYQASVGTGAREAAKDPVRPGKADSSAADKPRFDFYKILPGIEEPKTPQKAAERSVDKATAERTLAADKSVARVDERPVAAPEKLADKAAERAPKSTERYWLQAGSFASEGDAENLKAQLALSGWEATLQQATLPDRNVRFRVRLGPYESVDAMNRVRADLAKRGFEVSAIRN
jgi:cell division protein FtsN